MPYANSKLNQDGTHVPNMNSNMNEKIGTRVLNVKSKFNQWGHLCLVCTQNLIKHGDACAQCELKI